MQINAREARFPAETCRAKYTSCKCSSSQGSQEPLSRSRLCRACHGKAESSGERPGGTYTDSQYIFSEDVDLIYAASSKMNFTSHGETFLSDEEADSERQDCFVISHLFGVMGHGQRKKAEAQQLSIDDIV